MSESTISTNLTSPLFTTNEFFTCSLFNMKMVLFVICILITISCISSCINGIFFNENCMNGRCNGLEHFSNDQLFSYKDTFKPNYSYYQSTALTALNTESGSPSNLLFGQANRLIESGENPIYHLNIYCNLFVLNGNPFGDKEIKSIPLKQNYKVYLSNTSEKIFLDNLTKDNDGIYKLHFKSTQIDKFIKYNKVSIVYVVEDKETILLEGKLTIM